MSESTRQSGRGTPVTPAAGERPSRKFEDNVTIEVGDERNRSFIFAPDGGILRGTWSKTNLQPDEMVESVVAMPDIPGIHIQVDGRRRRLTIYDPLSRPEYATVTKEVSNSIREQFRENQGPTTEKVKENATDTEIKTWLYWMRRLVTGSPRSNFGKVKVGGPQAKIISGNLPSLEEILQLDGRIKIETYNTSPLYTKYLEERLAKAQES